MGVLFSIFLFLLSIQINCYGQSNTLRDIDSLVVRVFVNTGNSKLPTINVDIIKTGIELKLRQNNIVVVSNEDDKKAILQIAVDAMCHSSDPNTVAISAGLYILEPVLYLARDSEQSHSAITYRKSMQLLGGIDKYAAGIKENANDLIDIFLNDYYRDNPKK